MFFFCSGVNGLSLALLIAMAGLRRADDPIGARMTVTRRAQFR
jgi:hypothetical protein